MTEYTDNILVQSAALEALLLGFDLEAIRDLGERVQAGAFDRVILTGMGASLCAAYPAWALLARAGLPAWWLEAGELGEVASQLITPRTLLWIVSQAGKGPEALGLLDDLASRAPGLVLATTNEPSSPLAARAGQVLL